MKFLFSFVLMGLLSLNSYAQETVASGQNFNIMEVILFLNANQASNGKTSFKADHENKTLHSFDAEGRLIEESFIDENNDIISRRFNEEGRVISETKITEESVRSSAENAQTRHEQVHVPQAKALLQRLSQAAELYAKANSGSYPGQMTALTESNPPYITIDHCDRPMNPDYLMKCDLNADGYKFTAQSIWPQYESYVMKTGGIVEELFVLK